MSARGTPGQGLRITGSNGPCAAAITAGGEPYLFSLVDDVGGRWRPPNSFFLVACFLDRAAESDLNLGRADPRGELSGQIEDCPEQVL
jgi:hypothetical protein